MSCPKRLEIGAMLETPQPRLRADAFFAMAISSRSAATT
jgi:hypothetical protein